MWAQFIYCIIFYSFKHGLSPWDILGKLRKCGLEGMSQFFSDPLHEPNPCVLPSGQGILVALLAHGGDLVPEISTPKQFIYFSWLWPKVFAWTIFFPLKMIGSHWPTSTASPHSIEPLNGLKQLNMESQWGFSQAFPLMMIKVILPFIQTKANLKITTYLTPWGPKPLLLTKTSYLKHPKFNINDTIRFKTRGACFTPRARPQAQYKSLSSAKKPTNHVLTLKLKL